MPGRVRTAVGETATGFELTGESTPVGELASGVWASRHLLGILARKDFVVRYRRASFGLLWAVAVPLVQALVLAALLSKVVRFSTNVDYSVFVYSGVVLWTAFSNSLSSGSAAIVDGADLSTKVYFPRAVLPLVSVFSNAYGLLVSVVIFVVMAVASGVALRPGFVLIVPGVALCLLLSASFTLVLAGLHVYFRDVRYLVQAGLLVWFYASPVLYPLRAVGGLRPLLEANPMTGVIELFRAGTIGADPEWLRTVMFSVAWTVVLLVTATLIHRRYNRVFVDLL